MKRAGGEKLPERADKVSRKRLGDIGGKGERGRSQVYRSKKAHPFDEEVGQAEATRYGIFENQIPPKGIRKRGRGSAHSRVR